MPHSTVVPFLAKTEIVKVTKLQGKYWASLDHFWNFLNISDFNGQLQIWDLFWIFLDTLRTIFDAFWPQWTNFGTTLGFWTIMCYFDHLDQLQIDNFGLDSKFPEFSYVRPLCTAEIHLFSTPSASVLQPLSKLLNCYFYLLASIWY